MATRQMTKTTSKTDKIVEEKVKKTWNNEDYVACRSIVSGPLYVEGNKTKFLYTWADYGDVQDVQYQDLNWMIRSISNKEIYEPRIIIEDEELISQFPQLNKLYESLYSINDLKEILGLPLNQMVKTIQDLPKGVKDAVKGMASTMIDQGILDSINKIQALDEIFGTNMLLTLVQN